MAGVCVYGAGCSTVREYAQVLAPYCQKNSIDNIEEILRRLGIGSGLCALLHSHSAMGNIFGAVLNLNMMTSMAAVNRSSCGRICALGYDVLAALDNAGRKNIPFGASVLDALASCFEDINSLVDGFSQEGWLLLMTCNERMKEEFDTLHEAVIEILKEGGIQAMPDGRPLPAANYRDPVKPLRRTLKQLGKGSITNGVLSLRHEEKSLGEVARLLEVQPEVLAQEVSLVPESDFEVDTMYHSLIQRSSKLQQLLDNQLCSVSPEISNSNMEAVESEGGTAAAGLYADLFRWYDKNANGVIEQEELQAVLADLGMLEGKSAAEASQFTANHMRLADAQAVQQGLGLAFEAFCRFYDTLVMNKARQQLRFRLGLQAEDDLKATFTSFASFGSREPVTEMDGAHFQKICRDCDLLCRNLSTTDVDLIFTKVKTKGARKITFEQFITALSKVAEKKVTAFEHIVAQVLEAGGPIAHATKADAVRLHDDKSLYTGVYARGGPRNVEASFDLSQYLDRSTPADTRTSKKTATPVSSKKVMLLESTAASPSARLSTTGVPLTSTPYSASRGATGPHTRSSGRISGYDNDAVDAVPATGRDSPSEDQQKLEYTTVPPASPEQPGCMLLGMRRSSGTGGMQPPARTGSLKDVLKEAFAGLRKDKRPTVVRSDSKVQQQQRTPTEKTPMSVNKTLNRTVSHDAEPADLQDIFNAFATFGVHCTPSKRTEPVFFTNTTMPSTVSSRRISTPGSAGGRSAPDMDGFRFAKLCREAGIVDSSYTTTSVDIVFAKVKSKGSKKIDFAQFNAALALIAGEKGIQLCDITAAVQHCGGPGFNTATPDVLRRTITYDAAPANVESQRQG